MSPCSGGPAEDLAAQYLAGELTEFESEEFENHFIGCALCHTMVIDLQEVKVALAAEPIAIPKLVVGSRPSESIDRRILSFPARVSVRLVAFGSIAALLLVALVLAGIGFKRSTATTASSEAAARPVVASANEPQKPSEPANSPTTAQSNPVQLAQLASIADLQLPKYRRPELRDAEPASSAQHRAFLHGMSRYAAGDCDGAMRALTAVSLKSDDGLSAALYSGLCQLRGRNLKDAQKDFEKVAAAGDTPQLEVAEYYLAQTAFLAGDASTAEEWLSRTIAQRGDYEERARKQRSVLSNQAIKP